MKITSMGRTVLIRRAKAAIQHWWNEASRHKRTLYLVSGRHFLYLRWCPWEGGYAVVSEGLVASFPARTHTYQLPQRLTMKRQEALGLKGVALPGPVPASVMLSKLPAIREFLSCTEYDDKLPRTVGALRITSRGTMWTLTLTDPDRAARLCVTDASLDKALGLMEQLLGVPECPWEPDPYAAERLGKKAKK